MYQQHGTPNLGLQAFIVAPKKKVVLGSTPLSLVVTYATAAAAAAAAAAVVVVVPEP